MLREFIGDILSDHTFGWYRPGETAPAYHGLTADERTKEAEDLEWRCGCGWTTMDHHNGTSEFIDHCDHVADCVVKALKGRGMVDRLVEAVTGYTRVG